jgi:uncharacterized OsmC-like protein
MNSPAINAPQLLNGLDPQQIAQAAAGLVADPQQAQVKFRARSQWQGALRSRTEIESYELAGQRITRKHAIHSDEPLELLGTNQAPNPQDLLLAALNACMLVGFVAAATGLGISLELLEIESECALDLRGAFGLDPSVKPGADKIRYTVRVRGNGTPAQFEEAHQAMIANSPNRFHLTAPIPMESKLVVVA